MKNILNEKPLTKLIGRLKYTAKFVKDSDLKNKKVLDIGCGYGWFELNVLKRRVKQVAGIDVTSKDLSTAKNHVKNKKAVFKVGGALKIPFKSNYFDTVVSWEVIEHIPKNTEDVMFKEINRVLKKKGKFYLSTPYDSFLSKYFDPAWWLIQHRHYSKNKLIKLGQDHNFKVLEISIKGKFWSLIGLLNMYISKWLFRQPLFMRDEIENKIDAEYKEKGGFIGIFIKYEKK